MQNLLLTLVFLLSPILLTGCWDRTEINDVALVTGLGIDQNNEKHIVLTAEIHIPRALEAGPGGGGGRTPQTFVRSGEGKTLGYAISNLQEKLPRKVFWGQTKVVVFGEKLAKEGIQVPLDFLARHPQSQLRAHVFVAKGQAKDVLDLHPPLERSSSEVLWELAKSKVLMDINLKKLLQMTGGDAYSAALPMISKHSGERGATQQSIAYIRQTAIFRKNKMVGQIDDEMTRGILWVRNEIKHANISVTPLSGNSYVSHMMLHANSQLIPRIENGKWKMTVNVVTEDDVIVNGTNRSLMNPEFMQLLQEKLAKEIKSRMEEALKNVQQEHKVDILGFAEEFHRKYPKEWKKSRKDWDEIFPSVEVIVDVKASIRRPGMSTSPQGLPEDEVKQ